MIAAALLIDLYMREKIDIWSWELAEREKAMVDVGGKHADANAKNDAWAGPISNVYRAFVDDNPVLWTTEIPVVAGSSLLPPPHWLEAYVPIVDTIFEEMEVPPQLGEQPVWQSLIHRGSLVATEEVADEFDVFCMKMEKKLSGLPRCLARFFLCILIMGELLILCEHSCYLALPCFWDFHNICEWRFFRVFCRCCKRRKELRTRKDVLAQEEEDLNKLEIYEYVPLDMPLNLAAETKMVAGILKDSQPSNILKHSRKSCSVYFEHIFSKVLNERRPVQGIFSARSGRARIAAACGEARRSRGCRGPAEEQPPHEGDLSLSLYIYIYMYVCVYIYLSISLSIYIYIYVYILYTHIHIYCTTSITVPRP